MWDKKLVDPILDPFQGDLADSMPISSSIFIPKKKLWKINIDPENH